jgi:hypothetical protein
MKSESGEMDGNNPPDHAFSDASSVPLQEKPDEQLTQQGAPQVVIEEISRSEIMAAEHAAEFERLVADDSVVLGRLLQIRSQELDLKAYIRGLKFFSAALGR